MIKLVSYHPSFDVPSIFALHDSSRSAVDRLQAINHVTILTAQMDRIFSLMCWLEKVPPSR